MVLYHFSPLNGQIESINPRFMGKSVNAGREIYNQFENGAIKSEFLYKSNWFTKDTAQLELHRFGHMNVYSVDIQDSYLYNMDRDGFQTDRYIHEMGYYGYVLQSQVRLFKNVKATRFGKIVLPQGITFKTVGNAINGANLEDYLEGFAI